jgi:hypothetical protein
VWEENRDKEAANDKARSIVQDAEAQAAGILAEAQKELSESVKKVLEGRITQLLQQAEEAAAHAVKDQAAAVAAEREAAAAATKESERRHAEQVAALQGQVGKAAEEKVQLQQQVDEVAGERDRLLQQIEALKPLMAAEEERKIKEAEAEAAAAAAAAAEAVSKWNLDKSKDTVDLQSKGITDHDCRLVAEGVMTLPGVKTIYLSTFLRK